MTLQPDMMALHQAHSHFQQQHKQSLPTVEHDPAWPSPCEVGEPSKLNEIKWQAHARDPEGSLAALATALECHFPDGLDGFYGAFFAGNITAFIEASVSTECWSFSMNLSPNYISNLKLGSNPKVSIGP